jgi:hypothetical protein
MLRAMRGGSTFTWLASAMTSALLVFAAMESCVTLPPPDLGASTPHPPIIEHGGVLPLDDEPLTAWPSWLYIPVELLDPDESFEYAVFIDYQYDPSVASAPDLGPVLVRPPPTLLNGGTYLLDFEPPPAPLDGLCHQLEVVVAHSFASVHTPDSIGGDSVSWSYGPNGCPTVWEQDGAFPADAPFDGLQLVPDSGGPDS